MQRLVDARYVFQPIHFAGNINKGKRTGYYSNNIKRERKGCDRAEQKNDPTYLKQRQMQRLVDARDWFQPIHIAENIKKRKRMVIIVIT